MKNNRYIPKKTINPIIVQKKLEKLEEELAIHGKNIDAISKSHDNHITMLSNFTKHDIKNSVQSIDSIISSNTIEELTQEHYNSLKLNLEIIRETINNFSKLVPYSSDDTFEFTDLLIAIELLNRESLYINKISFIKECSEGKITFKLPFQSVLQMINNIIINAIKAFNDNEIERKIKLVAEFDSHFFYIKIFDNASSIPFKDINKIFEYGVSSTGGSGIGLYHAKYLCNLYQGKIEVFENEYFNEFRKYFKITLPILNEIK
jgi:signal transduction histidine kinase